ncbi:MAG: hypothetical protein QM740_15830 [Acidovorax sp.]
MFHEPPKPPPRFVPTLTDVVRDGPPPPAPARQPAPAPAAMPMPRMPSAPVKAPAPAPVQLSRDVEEQLIHRVMQRVDVALDQRLREAIATVVHEQTRSLLPRLREEVESVVRDAVYVAVAQELAGDDRAG